MARIVTGIAILLPMYYRKSIMVVWMVQRFPEMDEDEVESKLAEPDLPCYSLFSSIGTRQHICEPAKRQL